MSFRLLILCPGQGSQHGAMFDLARTDARAARFIDQSAPSFSEADMFENRIAQPLIVSATLAMWEALRDHVPTPALTAGYSIGELAAHSVAGTIASQVAVELAVQRARLMDGAAQAHPNQAMLAVSGVAVERVRVMAAEAGASLAIVTGEDSCIVGGEGSCVELLAAATERLGARCQLLPVAVASHTPL
ncbi:MAG TPA: acyltransferase domain-containing protein, partial [Telluria sp.]|nr:acyltransferase domain-containing protein [Telluria sp.]